MRRRRLPSLVVPFLALAGLVPAASARTVVPANGMLTWSSNRELGRHEIFVMKLDGGTPTRITTGGGQHPAWSPDGRWISYYSPADASTHVIRWDGTGDRKVCGGYPVFWMHDGGGVVCAVLDPAWPGWEFMSRSDQYLLAHPDLGTSAPLFKRSDFAQLVDPTPQVQRHLMPGGITHDGRWLVGWVFGMFERGYTADNGRFVTEQAAVVLDLLDPKKLYYLGPGCTTTTPPAGTLVYHVSREGQHPPDIFSLDLADVTTRESYRQVVGRADGEWGHDYFPKISNDGRYLTYAASLGCHHWYECDYEVFLHELGRPMTESVRLTNHQGNDNYPHLFVGEPWKPEPELSRIGLAPERLNLFASSDAPPAPRKVVVWSAAGKPLGEITARVPEPADAAWLSVKVTPVKEGQAELELTMNGAALPSGVHTARVEVTAPGAVNSPRLLEVRLAFTSSAAPPPPSDAGAGGASGASGVGGGSPPTVGGAGGTPAAGGGPGAADAPSGSDSSAPRSGSGCDCAVGSDRSASAGSAWLLALALLLRCASGRGRPARRPSGADR